MRHRFSGLDLSTGGTFSRALAALYYTGAPTDGSSAFLASAGSGVRRASENRGDGLDVGLLMEKAATNYELRSRALEHTDWVPGSVTTTANQNNGPLGDGGAERVQGSSIQFGPYQLSAGPAGLVVASSWVRAVTGTDGNYLNLFCATGTTRVQARGLVTTTTYQRNYASGTATTNSGFMTADGRDLVGLGVTVVGTNLGAHNEDNYIDLVQLEQGNYPTSPIPTAGASVSRPQDVLSYADGEYPSSFLTDGGKLRFAFDASSAEINASGELWYLLAGGGANDCVVIQGSGGGTSEFRLYCGGSLVATITTVSWSRGDYIDITWKPQAGYLSIDGPSCGFADDSGTGASWPSATDLLIGDDGGGSGPVTGRFLDAAGIGKPSIARV